MYSINYILPETVGVGDAPNTIYFNNSKTTTPTILIRTAANKRETCEER